MMPTAWKVFKYGVFLVHIFLYSGWIQRDTEYLSVFSPNTGIYGPEKTPYLDTFHTMGISHRSQIENFWRQFWKLFFFSKKLRDQAYIVFEAVELLKCIVLVIVWWTENKKAFFLLKKSVTYFTENLEIGKFTKINYFKSFYSFPAKFRKPEFQNLEYLFMTNNLVLATNLWN